MLVEYLGANRFDQMRHSVDREHQQHNRITRFHIKARANRNSNARSGPDQRRRCKAGDRISPSAQNHARPQETDPADNLRRQTHRVHIGMLAASELVVSMNGDQGHQTAGNADDHAGPDPQRFLLQLPVDADEQPEQHGH
ncbi:hypothetical protein D3C73_1149530 [compost metagenome]